MKDEKTIDESINIIEKIKKEFEKTILGQKDACNLLICTILSEENSLLEGVPGLGKTMMVKVLAKILGLSFKRIQFTPDLMPADITGTNIITETTKGIRSFSFNKGPIFSNMIIADEINRGTPKTQSAMLEAMQEKTVTFGNETHPLDSPFFVLATENPIEMEGTYILPEAQLDRFIFKIKINFPSKDTLKKLAEYNPVTTLSNVQQITNSTNIQQLINITKQIPISADLIDMATNIIINTHPSKTTSKNVKHFIEHGVSPRGLQALIKAAKAYAFLNGRLNVSEEDLQFIAPPTLGHRIIRNFEAQTENIETETIIDEILKKQFN